MTVVLSLEDEEGLRCVDFFLRPDGTYSFKEFRCDPEDGGRWSLVADYSNPGHGTRDEALRSAAKIIGWFEPAGGVRSAP